MTLVGCFCMHACYTHHLTDLSENTLAHRKRACARGHRATFQEHVQGGRATPHQPTSDFPEICGPRGGREHHQAVRALRRTTQPAGLGRQGEGSLTSSFCRVFLSSSILCCICFMVCDQSPTPTKKEREKENRSHPRNRGKSTVHPPPPTVPFPCAERFPSGPKALTSAKVYTIVCNTNS